MHHHVSRVSGEIASALRARGLEVTSFVWSVHGLHAPKSFWYVKRGPLVGCHTITLRSGRAPRDWKKSTCKGFRRMRGAPNGVPGNREAPERITRYSWIDRRDLVGVVERYVIRVVSGVRRPSGAEE